ncbi:MAG TPA: HNH/endonuclease VII fold putative polymorphic toxin [Pseudomonadota bacterium]|nr:HNH/endonuclease VII fold putative polymorphic toxin [Pseudomonadota bacterium]
MKDCLENKAHEAADELNEFRKKSPNDKLYTVGGWGFDAAASAAASAVVPGAGAVFGGVVRTGEKAVGKAIGKKVIREAEESAIEHADEAAARRLLHAAQERAKKEAEKRAAKEAAQDAAEAGTRPPNLSPEGAGRRGAFREAKRQSDIPVSQQPSKVEPNRSKRRELQPGRSYDFEVRRNGKKEVVNIRDDAGGHHFGPDDPQNRGPHFNDARGNHYDY